MDYSDSVYGPSIAWNVVIIAVLTGMASSILHGLVVADALRYDIGINITGSRVFYITVMAGLMAMTIVYKCDYTAIAKYSKVIAIVMFFILHIGSRQILINGEHIYLTIGMIHFSVSAFMLLYIPIYGAIIYKYRGRSAEGFLNALIWMVVPTMFIIKWTGAMTALVLITTMTVQLSIAVAKGWFNVHRKLTITALWVLIFASIVSLLFLYKNGFLAEHQIGRFIARFYSDNDMTGSGSIFGFLDTVNLIGDSGKELSGYFPDPTGGFLLLYLTNRFGLVMGLYVVVTVAVMIIEGFLAIAESRDQSGLVMGVGCMNVLLIYLIINLLQNMGVIPYADSFLPFFSTGGWDIIIAYIYLGVILSIYKG